MEAVRDAVDTGLACIRLEAWISAPFIRGRTLEGKPATSSFTADSADGLAVPVAGAVLGRAVPAAEEVDVADVVADELLAMEEATGVAGAEHALIRTTADAAAAARRLLRVNGR